MTTATARKVAVNSDKFPTHEIESIVYCGERTCLYRARRKSGGLPVMLKTILDDHMAREAALLITHEYEMVRRVQGPGIIRILSMTQRNHVPAIEFEDFGGDSLDHIVKKHPLTLEQTLHIALQLTRGVADIHDARIIHKDINPSNVVYNPETGVAKIIDFGIAIHLPREQVALANAERLEGSLPYISPEQTGRMNRAIDYRTDLYSLGATLYELLTGQLLFVVSEPIEWIHSHIAKRPVPPSEVNPGIPRIVSDIVMKLLAKNAEDRYQSAQGVLTDLAQCRDQLSRKGRIEPFALASQDISDRFQIPQRLYGREDEVARLLAGFDLVENGGSEMILVSGYSGIGKTSLIREIYKPMTEHRGHFVSGKFDPLHRNIPYSALAAAMRDLVRQLLTESDEALARWREKILDAVGGNGQLIVDMIGELELIIGPQPEMSETAPVEAEQRFQLTFHRFAEVFCGPDHPLVVFLDDLQWIDSATMRLLDLLSSGEASIPYLLFIGAYRSNEVQAGHPVALWLEALQQRDVNMQQIRLHPLKNEHLMDLLADTLGVERHSVASLAGIVEEKTAGNPFFTEAFLKALHEDGLIRFSRAKRSWVWDMEKIQARQATDNVVDLMTARLQRLCPETLELLKLGACLGFRFELSELTMVAEQAPMAVSTRLREAMAEGLLAPSGDAVRLPIMALSTDSPHIALAYTFAHDRIHQAAYALLDEAQRHQTHFKIGRLMQDRLSPTRQNEMLFEITNHLDLGSALIKAPEDRIALCRLNLRAGKRAVSASAYPPAFNYFKTALDLVDESLWDKDYALALTLYSDAAQAAYLTGDYDEMDRLLSIGFARAQQLLDKVKLYQVRMAACMARGQLLEAIDTAKPVLAELGHRFPARPRPWHAVVKLLWLKWRLRRTSIDDLRQLPEMTDPIQLATIQIGEGIGSAAMFAQPELLPLLIMQAVGIVADHGHTPRALGIIAAYGMIEAETLGQVDRGQAFGRMALELMDRLHATSVVGRVRHIYNGMVRHWKEPLRNCLEPLREAFLECLENGDFEYAAHAGAVRMFYTYEAGMDLNRLFEELQACHAALKPLKQGPRIAYLESELQKVANLLGHAVAADPTHLKGAYYDVDQMTPVYNQSGDNSLMFIDHLNQMRLKYLFGQYEEALALSGNSNTMGLQGFFTVVPYCFMDSLIRLAMYPASGKSDRRRLLREVARNHKKLKRWARTNPANCLSKVRLVEAERLRILGRDFQAHEMFDEAIHLAREQGFIHEEAMASELCGLMHTKVGRLTLGTSYLIKARDLYEQWGAMAKVRDLERRFPQLMRRTRPISGKTTPLGTAQAAVDMGSLIKGLKAIAEETVLSRMVEAIIATAMEVAGAQKGMLLLRNPAGVLCIEAEAGVDGGDMRFLQSIPVAEAELPGAVVNYVNRTRSGIVIHDAGQPNDQIPGLSQDAYIRARGIRSVLCLPIMAGPRKNSDVTGMLYLENNRTGGAFTQERFDTLEIICLSAAGRLELSRKAVIDGLTELYNRDYFQNILNQEFVFARRHGHALSLIMIDIDHFKKFNDTWGHQVGDLVLKEVARLIKASCRSANTVARYGGEEMAVILPMTPVEKAETVAQRIRQAIEKHRIAHNGETLSVTISLGLAAVNETIADKEGLVRRADEALYRSKAAGRNRLTVG